MSVELNFKPMGMCHLTVGLGLESPPIRKGSDARKAWRYFRRIDRIEARSRAIPNLTIIRSMEYGGCVLDTMDHLLALGIEFDECGNWRDRTGHLKRLCQLENAGKGNWHEDPWQYHWNERIAKGFLPVWEWRIGFLDWIPSEALLDEWNKAEVPV